MTEWGVVGVVIVLVGLVGGIVKPILSLNGSIVELTTLLKAIKDSIREFTAQNEKAHDELWKHNKEQDCRLGEHDNKLTRIETTLEIKEKGA